MDENKNGITPELISDILQNVKILSGITDNSKDQLLTVYINMICNNILIKTNRRVFVPELKYVVINLVKDKYDTIQTDADLQSVQSMSEYDRSVTFGVSEPIKYKLNLIAEKQLDENENLINKYKLLYRT